MKVFLSVAGGDKYMIPSLQNSAMDAFKQKAESEHTIPTSQISRVWEKTLSSSPIRRYVLERTVDKLSVADFRKYESHWSREALLELVETYVNNKEDNKKRGRPARGKCYCHIHKEGEEC